MHRRALALVAGLVVVAGCGGSGSSGGGFASTVAPATSATATVPVAAVATTTTAPAPVGTRVVASGTIKALTYNVAGLPQGISASQPVANTPQISPLLNGYELVLVQEDFWYHAALAKDAKHAFRTPPLTSYATFVNDGLNGFSAWPLQSLARTKWLDCNGWVDQANDCLSSKGFLFAQLEVRPGVTIDVWDVHADAGRSSSDVKAREKQYRQLADAINAVSKGHTVIVAGDTNLKTTKEPADEAILQTFMRATGLKDVARELGQPDVLDRFLWKDTPSLELQPLRWRVATEFVDKAGQPLSDHEAIHVDFEWRSVR